MLQLDERGGRIVTDQRRHSRVPLSIDGRWQGLDTASLCAIANLSLGGGFARTPTPPAANEHGLLTLFFAGRGALPVMGHVARVEPGVGFGMQFGEMSPETRYRLGEEIAQIRRRMQGRSPTRSKV